MESEVGKTIVLFERIYMEETLDQLIWLPMMALVDITGHYQQGHIGHSNNPLLSILQAGANREYWYCYLRTSEYDRYSKAPNNDA